MAEIDGFNLLIAIGNNADTFRHVEPEVNKSARSWFEKTLRQGDLTLDQVRLLQKIAGQNFRRIVGEFSTTTLRGALKKIDKFYVTTKVSQKELTNHLVNLADGTIDAAPEPPPKPSRPRRPKNDTKNRGILTSGVADQISDEKDVRTKNVAQQLKPEAKTNRSRAGRKK